MSVNKNEATFYLDFQNGESRVSYVKVVLWIFIGLHISFLANVFYSDEYSWMVYICVSIAFLLGLFFFVSDDTTNIVIGISTWATTIISSCLAWSYSGLYDTGVFFYPCVLIFAAIFGGKTLFCALFFYMQASFYFLAYSAVHGISPNNVIADDDLWSKANYMATLLSIYSIAVACISAYIKKLIDSLSFTISQSIAVKKEADYQIFYDNLTGLPNQEMCKKNIKGAIEKCSEGGYILGLTILNISNLEWVRSNYGNEFSSRALSIVTERLLKLGDDYTLVYRNSENGFILTKLVKDKKMLNDFCYQVIRSIFHTIEIDEHVLQLSSYMGVSVAPRDSDSYDRLIHQANTALYRAKRAEANSFVLFEKSMEVETSERLTLVQDLREALEKSEFELHYQPKIDLLRGDVVGAEALIRWRKSGQDQLISPIDFIPAAEESGLISEIGKWVIETACDECSAWSCLGLPRLQVAVNLSPIQFQRGNLPNQVFRSLKKANLDPSLLELEITESLFLEDEEHIKSQIYSLSSQGVNFAIDDFGTGYSNLNYLAKFNASTLKIDMSFIRNMLVSTQHQHIVSAIIKMSKVMEIECVAEGVEDNLLAQKLKDMGCSYGQGYYWARPLPKEEFIAFVKSYKSNAKKLDISSS